MYLKIRLIINNVPVESFVHTSIIANILTSGGELEWCGTWYDFEDLPDEFNEVMSKIVDCWLPY